MKWWQIVQKPSFLGGIPSNGVWRCCCSRDGQVRLQLTNNRCEPTHTVMQGGPQTCYTQSRWQQRMSTFFKFHSVCHLRQSKMFNFSAVRLKPRRTQSPRADFFVLGGFGFTMSRSLTYIASFLTIKDTCMAVAWVLLNFFQSCIQTSAPTHVSFPLFLSVETSNLQLPDKNSH